MRWLLVAALALGFAAALPAPASADTGPPVALGWWTRRAGATARGDGGFELAAGVQGEESVAALRLAVPADATSVRLVVTEAAGAVPSDTAFRACPAVSSWDPADAGAWDARPTADCDAGSVDAAAESSGRWALDLTAFAASATGPTIDVVLLPTPPEAVPGFGTSFGFTAAFTAAEVATDRPTTAVAAGASPRPASAAATTATPPASLPARTPIVAVPAVGPALPPPSARTTPTSTSAALVGGGGPGEAIAAPMFDLARSDDDRPWGRLLVLVPLSAATGLGAAAARNLARRRAEGTVLVSRF